MKEVFKDTKFWMYLPFACVWGLKMSKWVFEPDTVEGRQWRYIFQLLNVILTVIVAVIGSGLVFNIYK